jgi:flagellar basal-body rod modification protein FlgD
MNIDATILAIRNSTNRLNYERGKSTMGSDTLTKDAFMQLLMAQLQNQDPLSPTDNSQFLQQQTSLAQVEKLDNLLAVLQGNNLLNQASNLVGKKVDLTVPGTTASGIPTGQPQVITGLVQSADFKDGEASIQVNNKSYKMSQITKLYGTDS